MRNLLASHRGMTASEIAENEESQWELEANTGSGDINRAITRIMSQLPQDFCKRLAKLPNAQVYLSIAVLAPATGGDCLVINNENLARLKAMGASLRVLIFSRKEFSAWNK